MFKLLNKFEYVITKEEHIQDLAHLKDIDEILICLLDSVKVNSGKANAEIKQALINKYIEERTWFNKRIECYKNYKRRK